MIPTPRTDAPNRIPQTSPRPRARATSHVSSRRVDARVVVLVRVASSEIARDARHALARAVPIRALGARRRRARARDRARVRRQEERKEKDERVRETDQGTTARAVVVVVVTEKQGEQQ